MINLKKMQKIEVIEFKEFNNCDELADFIINELNDYKGDFIIFEGEECEVTTTTLDYVETGIIRDNTLIAVSASAGGSFDVHSLQGTIDFSESHPCVVVPDYAKSELIAVLKGEW